MISDNEAYYERERLYPHIPVDKDIDSWICRKVFFGKNIVVKGDNSLVDNQCSTEKKIWNKAKKTKWAKFFVPVLDKGKFAYDCDTWRYVVVPKIEFDYSYLILDHPDIEDFRKCIDKFDLMDIDIEFQRNCAVSKDGRLLMFDYGMTNK